MSGNRLSACIVVYESPDPTRCGVVLLLRRTKESCWYILLCVYLVLLYFMHYGSAVKAQSFLTLGLASVMWTFIYRLDFIWRHDCISLMSQNVFHNIPSHNFWCIPVINRVRTTHTEVTRQCLHALIWDMILGIASAMVIRLYII